MKIIDMHCDTISELADRGGELWKNSGHLDLKRMQESGYLLQNFALFVDIGKCTPTPWERVCALYEVYRTEMEKNKNRIVPVLCYEDILKNEACGKLSAFLTVEEGAVCGGSLERLRELYDMGDVDGRLTEKSVQEKIPGTGRSSCAGENPTTAIETEKGETGIRGSDGRDAACGLTETGRDFVTEMERLGMIPDVSHLSDAGFDDVWECTKKPFVASHSNARAVCPSLRNLTDDQIRRLAERGGCMGLNYYDKFLVDGGSKDPEVLWEALIRQARHITDVGGMEILGLGSDFDGIPTNPALPSAEAMPVLWDRLKTAGFTENQLDGIFWGNVMRVYRDAL